MSNSNRRTISTHVLDTQRGEPARGVPVSLWKVEGSAPVLQSSQETDADGRIGNLAPDGWVAGSFQIAFDVAAYFARRGNEPGFFTKVVINFEITDTERGYHIPLLISPYACSSYRGS